MTQYYARATAAVGVDLANTVVAGLDRGKKSISIQQPMPVDRSIRRAA
jgi:hypothetical protein